MGRDREQHRPPTPPELRPDDDATPPGDPDQSRHAPAQIGFPISLVRPPVADRGLSIAAGLVALVIGLAVLKPWAPGSTDAPAAVPAAVPRGPTPTAAATPRPTSDSPEGLAGPVCLGASSWRIASLETWRNQDVRVWRAVEPMVDATGPLDPAIPTVPVVGLEIGALGWCAPAYGRERPVGPALVEGWIVIDGAADELELRQVLPVRGITPLAALYHPIAPCALGTTCAPGETRPVPQRWETGRVVFRYADRGAAATVWFGADIQLYVPPVPEAPATSAPSPTD
jgi:hypothetical protein